MAGVAADPPKMDPLFSALVDPPKNEVGVDDDDEDPPKIGLVVESVVTEDPKMDPPAVEATEPKAGVAELEVPEAVAAAFAEPPKIDDDVVGGAAADAVAPKIEGAAEDEPDCDDPPKMHTGAAVGVPPKIDVDAEEVAAPKTGLDATDSSLTEAPPKIDPVCEVGDPKMGPEVDVRPATVDPKTDAVDVVVVVAGVTTAVDGVPKF